MKCTKGYALLSVVTILGALLVAGVAAVRMTRAELHRTADNVAARKAFYLAESGVQRALACLSQDRATAASSTTYTYSQSNQPVGDGTYTVSVVQDPKNPTDATRKQITGVGAANGQQATVVAQAIVQTEPAATICFTDTGTCKIQALVGAATMLFNGDIFSNNNAAIQTVAGLLLEADGTISARNSFAAEPLTVAGLGATAAVLSTLDAELYSGVAYTPTGVLSLAGLSYFQGLFGNFLGGLFHTLVSGIAGALNDPHQSRTILGSLLTPLGVGIHFSNGTNGHGVVQTIDERPFPRVDWESLRRDMRTTIVNAENVPTGTSWDAASQTWIVGSVFSPAVDQDVIYYVEGNVHLTSLQLVKGARMTIAARGWSVIEALSVLNTGLVSGSRQDVRIITEKDNSIGLNLIAYLPYQVEDSIEAIGSGADVTGIGLNVAGVLSSDNRIFAYSETGDVWAKTSTINLLSSTKMSVIAKNDATIAFTGSIASGAAVSPYQP